MKCGGNKKKITAVFLCGVWLCLCSLVSCGSKDGTRVVFTTGFAKDEVFLIEDESCKKAELMVYLTTMQNQYEAMYGAEIWNASLNGVTLEENVKETVLARIAQVKSMYLLALDKGLSLDETELGKVRQAAGEYYASLNKKEIAQMDVSPETVENLYTEYAMADKVYRFIIQDVNPEISDDEARRIKVQHILLKTYTEDSAGERVELIGSTKEAVYKKACEIREMAAGGEYDFAELASRYSEDKTITFSFGKGEMELPVEDAAFRLETGEVSEVVESGEGYQIFKCLSTLDREETDANKEKIVEEKRHAVFSEEYDLFVSELARKLNQDLWDEIVLIHDKDVKTNNFFAVYDKYFKNY